MNCDRKLVAFLLFIIVIALISDIYIYVNKLNGPTIRSDGLGYYAYLPSIFIYNDITLSHFIGNYPGIIVSKIDKYPIGTAIMEFPFFFLADCITLLTSEDRDGSNLLYQTAIAIAAIFYLIVGLIFTNKLSLLFFDKTVSFLLLPILTFGTGLFHYATYDASFSHVFSFCLVSAYLYFLYRPKSNYLIPAAILGLIFLTRMPNVIIAILLIWQEISNFKGAIPYRRWGQMIVIFLSIASLQFIYYFAATGHFLLWSYGGEGFTNWFHPEIFNVLFSDRKGLFFWYPILSFSLPGFVLIRRNTVFLPLVVFILTFTYITSSWWDWAYGGSFGMRPYIDILAALSIPLAATLEKFNKKLCPLTGILVGFTVSMMLLYWYRTIPFDGFSLWSYL